MSIQLNNWNININQLLECNLLYTRHLKQEKRKDVGPSANRLVSSCACFKIYESGIFLTPQKMCSNLKELEHRKLG